MAKDSSKVTFIDLKTIRKNMDISQEELSKLLNISQDKISRLEGNGCKNIDIELLLKISQVTGLSVDKLITVKSPELKSIEFEDCWEKNKELKRTILKDLSDIKVKDSSEDYYNIEPLKQAILNVITDDLRKPSIAFMGLTNAGKSSFINHLIGYDKLPTNLKPVTRNFIIVKHKDDKPSFIQDEVVVFKNIESVLLLNNLSNTKEYIQEKFEENDSILATGDASLLEKYCTYESEDKSAKVAVIYVDSEILKNVDLIDYPGYQDNNVDTDDEIIPFDGVVYLSRLNSNFLSAKDVEYLRTILSRLATTSSDNPINNCFIIASQANGIVAIKEDGNNEKEAIEKVLRESCDFLTSINTNDEDIFSELKKSNDLLQSRFYAYDIKDFGIEAMYDFRAKFDHDFKTYAESLPMEMSKNTKDKIIKIVRGAINNINNKINLFSELEANKKLMNESDLQIEKVKTLAEVQGKIDLIKHEVAKHEELCMLNFKIEYEDILREENILKIIKTNNLKAKQKKNIEKLLNVINAKLDNSIKQILDNESKQLFSTITKTLEEIRDKIKILDGNTDNDDYEENSTSQFNSEKILKIFNVGAIGALLGVRHSVKFLPFLGLAPILNVGIGALVVLGVVAGLAGVWEKDIARKINKYYKEPEIENKYKSIITSYWSKVKDSIDENTDNLYKSLEKEYNNRLYISNFDDYDDKKKEAEELKSQLENFISKM